MLPFYTYLLVAGLPHFALQIPSFPSPRSFVPHCHERHLWLPTDTLPLILRPSRFTEQVILPIKFPQLFADRCRRCRRRCSVSCARSTLSRLPILSFSILSCRFRLRHPAHAHAVWNDPEQPASFHFQTASCHFQLESSQALLQLASPSAASVHFSVCD
jgi:hypothetical protein